jgi:hypothetical protein
MVISMEKQSREARQKRRNLTAKHARKFVKAQRFDGKKSKAKAGYIKHKGSSDE